MPGPDDGLVTIPPVDPDVPDEASVHAHSLGPRTLRDRWDLLAVIAAGGALGSLARWSLSEAIPRTPSQLPVATWLANATGALVLGALMVFIADVWPPQRYLRPFLGVGVLGGYTTFSTYMLDTRTLIAEGRLATALAYLFGTLLTGLVAVWAGVLIARVAVALLARLNQRRNQLRPRESGAPSSGRSRTPPDHEHDLHPDPDARSRR
jgi:CrcB protein